MKKILCADGFEETNPLIFGMLLDDGTLDIKRHPKHRFLIIGKDFTVVGTNVRGDSKTVVTVKNGQLVEEGLSVHEINNEEDLTPVDPENIPEPKPEDEVKPEDEEKK